MTYFNNLIMGQAKLSVKYYIIYNTIKKRTKNIHLEIALKSLYLMNKFRLTQGITAL